MRFPFTRVPRDPADVGRPLLSLAFEGVSDPVTCLLDTGTVHNRLSAEWAHEAGIDLSDRAETTIGLGGEPSVSCWLAEDVQIIVGDAALSVPVWFCDPWDLPFGLLGQEGFFQYFTFVLHAADEYFDLEFID